MTFYLRTPRSLITARTARYSVSRYFANSRLAGSLTRERCRRGTLSIRPLRRCGQSLLPKRDLRRRHSAGRGEPAPRGGTVAGEPARAASGSSYVPRMWPQLRVPRVCSRRNPTTLFGFYQVENREGESSSKTVRTTAGDKNERQCHRRVRTSDITDRTSRRRQGLPMFVKSFICVRCASLKGMPQGVELGFP